jgi:hypothetical protein
MPWRRTEAVVLRRRGVWGFVRGILGQFGLGDSGPPNRGEGVRTSVRINAALDNDILNTQMKTCSHKILVGNL